MCLKLEVNQENPSAPKQNTPQTIDALIKHYMAEAEKVNQYISKLKGQLHSEKDVKK